MSDTVTVIDLLEEMEEILDTSSTNIFTNKVAVDPGEMRDLIEKVRKSLPDDVQQARWIRHEKDRILNEAKEEYMRILNEAKKEADRLVEEHIITARAEKIATEIYNAADEYSERMTLKTYDYMDNMIYKFNEKMNAINSQYAEAMHLEIDSYFEKMGDAVEKDREQLHQLAEEVSNRPKPVHKVRVDLTDE